jgi:cation diffusion facilitator CzcD-associated flavoprotein CzcO
VLASSTTVRAGVIIAAGVVYRRLEAPRIDGLLSRGVHYGSAPGEAEMCRGRRVAIVGAANSAGQAVIHADKGAHVTLLCRGAGLDRSMSRYLYVLVAVAPLAFAARKWLRCDRHGDILTAYRFLAAEEAPPA